MIQKQNLGVLFVFLIGLITATSFGVSQQVLNCEGFSVPISIVGQVPNQEIGICKLEGTPSIRFEIDNVYTNNNTIVFTPIADFGNCVQGLGFQVANYSRYAQTEVCTALASASRTAFQNEFNKFKVPSTNTGWGGRF